MPLLARRPVRLGTRGRDERWVEIEVSEEEGGGGESLEGEVERGEAALQSAECLAVEGFVGSVAGLQQIETRKRGRSAES